ncbi:MAG: tRNA-dihydrouridine synthase family protein [Sulfuricella sp.]|nr:tRNA-dihydrouridine synthase family protein [Sulfuricella sp.]
MRLILAPMEGLADQSLREILTRLGGIDLCVAEFVRVTNHLLTEKMLLRTVPELASGGCTRAGVPVRVQLLGSDPVCLAENAAFIAGLGAPGIDLNFGYPAPTVNRHGGGAVLLQYPEQIHTIVAATRRAVPEHIPVTAKMRLGLEDTSLTLDCARAIEAGGADEITVHARTKTDRYRPPARWEWLAHIREAVKLPVVANGEVWTPQDSEKIRQVSGCTDVMIGRGAIVRPDLMRRIKTGERPCTGRNCFPGSSITATSCAPGWTRSMRRGGSSNGWE